MKRLIFFTLLALFASSCGSTKNVAENDPFAIQDTFFDCKFGANKSTIVHKLHSSSSLETEKDFIRCYGKEFGGIYWNIVQFDLNSKNKFFSISFISAFSSEENSRYAYTSIKESLTKKYPVGITRENSWGYVHGERIVALEIERKLSRVGEFLWYVTLSYYDNSFNDKKSDF